MDGIENNPYTVVISWLGSLMMIALFWSPALFFVFENLRQLISLERGAVTSETDLFDQQKRSWCFNCV
jgi:hypothetical protein